MPTPVLSHRSPFQILFGQDPTYSKLRVLGCLCFPWLRPYIPGKLSPPSKPCIFVGYSTSQSAYRCYDIVTGHIYISRHVQFMETNFPGTPSISPELQPASKCTITLPFAPPMTSPQLPQVVPYHTTTSSPDEPSSAPLSHQHAPMQQSPPLPPATTSSLAPSAEPAPLQRTHSMRTRSLNNIHKPKSLHAATKHPLSSDVEPTSVMQVLADPRWRDAMSDEYTALLRHGTWDLVPSPPKCNIIGCKWVFRIKRKPDGSIDKYKARLVAKGFHQRPGIDFKETFSPVIKPATIRAVLTLATSSNWTLRQLDVSNAFLHGNLDLPVYMKQPPGFTDPTHPSHVCLLRRSLYGLRQPPQAWYESLCSALEAFGLTRSKADSSLFVLHKGNDHLLVLAYVDDLIITGSSSSLITSVTRHLQSTFAVKDLGPLSYFLGIEVAACKEGIFLSQHKYMIDLLHRHKMDGVKPVHTPAATKQASVSGSVDSTEYRSAIGGLQYLTITRPDIAFTVNRLAQHMSSPTCDAWHSVKQLFRYLKGTLHHGTLLRRTDNLTLTAYSDSDFGGDLSDCKSTSAYIVFLGKTPISWGSRKQCAVARSSAEAEYRSLATTASEICWLRHLFDDLRIPFTTTPRLLCDNMGATRLALNPVQHSRMKHIAIDLHFVRDLASKGLLVVSYVSTQDQLADLLTKPLARTRFQDLRSKISVANGTSILRGRISQDYLEPSR